MPLNLFLSHKHADALIAVELAEFLRLKSGGRVRVHLSSDPRFAGPRFGKNLNSELRTALWHTDAFVLLYTTIDHEWSYCMWECGMAADPNSPDTTLIVFQCGADIPGPLADMVRVNARRLEDVLKFTRQFFTETILPNQTEPLCPGWKDSDCEKAARDLHESLQRVLPSHDQPEMFSPWPNICVEMPLERISRIEQDRSNAVEIIKQFATVDGDARAAEIFGLASFGRKRSLGDVLAQWRRQFPDRPVTWFDFCCEQIVQGAARELPVVKCAPVKDSGGQSEFTPLLTQVRRVPWEGKMLFDFAFYDLSDPRGTLVTERMIEKSGIFRRTIGEAGPGSFDLRILRQEMRNAGRNRVPMLNQAGAVLYVIHKSSIDDFLVDTDIAKPTVADLLNDPANKQSFEASFAVVSRDATLADASAAIDKQCSDVFVTNHGKRDEPILGWLTNADLSREPARGTGAAAGSS